MSAANKFGRAAGRGQTRPLLPPKRGIAPLRQGPHLKERAALGNNKGIGGTTSAGNSNTGNSPEETYQLVSAGPGSRVPFAMATRLTPEILAELKRVEAEGGKASMKFGINSSGHVIKAGKLEFKFSSVSEPGNLCDIYEEKQGGEDGQGLLVEAGCVWRKLSVQRTLSVFEKDRVKRRSEEAERKQKSRKAIVLDHGGTPLAATQTAPPGEANGRRPLPKLMKEPPPKKRKVMSPVGSAAKPKLQSTIPTVGDEKMPSPASQSPEPSNGSSRGLPSQTGSMHPPKGRFTVEEGIIGSPTNKGNAGSHREKPSVSTSAAVTKVGGHMKMGLEVNMTELRNFLIVLLKENPKGMTIKAVEKAISEAMPNSNLERKNIEKIIRSIASLHAPGKYLLNQGVEKGIFTKPASSSGSSPETAPAESPSLMGHLAPVDSNGFEGTTEIENLLVPRMGEDGQHTISYDDLENKAEPRSPLMSNASLSGQRAGNSGIWKAVETPTLDIQKVPMPRVDTSSTVSRDLWKNKKVVEVCEFIPGNNVEQISVGTELGPDPELHRYVQDSPLVREELAQSEEGRLLDSRRKECSSPKSTAALNTDGSDTSSSSESSSGSDTNSESSGSGSESESGSESGSDSDSEASSSSSEENNMDEDVDIISEDENETRSDARQKQKVKEVKSAFQKEDSKVHKEDFRGIQDGDQLGCKVMPKLDPVEMPLASCDSVRSPEDADIADALEGDIEKVTSDLVEKVFGPEEDTLVTLRVDGSPCEEGHAQPIGPVSTSHGTNVKQNKKSNSRPSEVFSQHQSFEPESVPHTTYKKQDKKDPSEGGYHSKSFEEAKSSQKANSNRDQRRLKNISEPGHPAEVETRTEKVTKRWEGSDSYTDKKFTTEDEDKSNIRSSKVGAELPQRGEHGTQFNSKGQAVRNIVERPFQRLETGENSRLETDSREQGNDATIYDVPPSRGLYQGLEPSKRHFSNSPSEGKEGMRQLDRSVPEDTYRQQSSIENKKISISEKVSVSKHAKSSEFPDLRKRSLDTSMKDRTADLQNSPRGNGLSAQFGASSEASGRLHEGDMSTKVTEVVLKSARDPEQVVTKGKDEASQAREKTYGANISRSIKQDETVGRPLKDLEPQHSQQKDSGFLGIPPKSSSHSGRLSKDLDQLTVYDREAGQFGKANRDPGKLLRQSKQSEEMKRSELTERAGLIVEQAERPVRDAEFRRAKDNNLNTSWKDAEPVGKSGSNGGFCGLPLKEGKIHENKNVELEQLACSGPTSTGNLSKKTEMRDSPDLELGELRESVHGDQPREQTRLPPHEGFKGRQFFDPSNVSISTKKENVSPENENSQALNKVRIDMRRSSPLKLGDDVAKPLQDSLSGKRRLESNEIVESGRSNKKVVGIHSQPQLQRSVAEVYSKPKGTDAIGSSPSDGLDQAARSGKKIFMENARDQDHKGRDQDASTKEHSDNRGSISDKLRLSGPSTRASSKIEPSRDHTKKQTPTSSEVGGEFFAVYEKQQAVLRGPIKSYEQFNEYCNEYREKYPIYIRLNTSLESIMGDFESFRREIEQARLKGDKNKLASIYEKVRSDYLQCRKRFKRMQQTFLLLHEELRVIKQRCKDYARKVGQG